MKRLLSRILPLFMALSLGASALGCGGSSLAARYPNAMLRPVCAMPEAQEPGEYAWVYTASGRFISSGSKIEFDQVASSSKFIFVFDVDASKDSPSILPVPDNALECHTGFSWLDPEAIEYAPATGCRGNCKLPSSSAMFLSKPCPLTVQVVAEAAEERPDPHFFAQPVDVRSPFLQPLMGVASPPNCATSTREEQKRQAELRAEEIGRQYGRALGDYQGSFNSVGVFDEKRRKKIFAQDPLAFELLQLDLARKLNAIPEMPVFEDPELAQAALSAFEKGYGGGIDEARARALAIDLAWALAQTLCGNVACAVETAGIRALQLAITRVRAMPLFIPGTAGGSGFFLKRVPKANVSATATIAETRTPALAPGARPAAPPPPPPKVATPPNVGSVTGTQSAPSGQLHHGISEKVFEALEARPNLKGSFKLRDPQFTARAVDLEAHNGYQDWHKALDREIVAYIQGKKDLTKKDFAVWLYKRYKQPDLAKRFPGGLGANK